jgi:hypothetical protein
MKTRHIIRSLSLFALLLVGVSLSSAYASNSSGTAVPPTVTLRRTPTPVPTNPSLRNNRFLNDKSLISGKPCSPPCWHGITPGKTAWEDAVKLLLKDAGLEPPFIQVGQNGVSILATWKGKGGEPCCQMVTEDGKTVTFILLQFDPTMTTGELIQAHGEPTYVVGTPGDETQAIINLFYPDDGLIAIAFVRGAKSGELSESSEIIGAWYLTEERMDLILKTSMLYGWKGYGPYSIYRPDAPVEQFDVTPSVTLTPTLAPSHP